VHILKYRSLGSPRFSGRIGRKVLPHGVSSLHKKVDGDGVLDTLVAGYPGYNAKRITLYDLQNRGIEIMLSRLDVSPWKGLGPLEYRGKMVRIHAAGHCFQMGTDPATAWWARPEEMPHHRVSFSYDFWMDTAEVTRAEYSVMMKRFYNIEIVPWREPSSTFWTPSEEEPAHFLSWYDAVLYCNARTLADGRTDTVYRYDSIIGDPGDGCTLEGVTADLSRGGYRLPTEAEWEYACRAANPYENYWVSGPPVTFAGAMRELFENAWGRRSYYPRPMPVGTKKPNAYGLYDMIGNVFEWCNDWYGPYDTEDQTDPVGPAQGSLRVMRGGSCEVYYPDDPQNRATSATRWAKAPETVNRPIGIRVVLPVR
jgi:formylglycine-generating enzyme required for sulfatase activity